MSIVYPAHHGHRWLVNLLVKFLKSAEDNAETQIKVHKIMMRFWAVNFCVATFVFFTFPGFWATASIYYVVAISLYANFATDYGAVSASQAYLKAGKAAEQVVEGLTNEQ